MDPIRHQKAEAMRTAGGQPYAAAFERSHTLQEAQHASDGTTVSVAGRVMLLRDMGKMLFATLQDHTGRLQIALKIDLIDAEEYRRFTEMVDLGDIIGCTGERFATRRGELSVRVAQWTMLSKALRQPPEKWHGLQDPETLWRQRYLDLFSNRATFDRFLFRSRFLEHMRRFYWTHQFIEVETPVLVNAASGALATPFQTHHSAYDLDMFLRIAPETYLKECIIGGFDRVFEVARVFRNEGLDPSHLQDFTMVEHYVAYWDYQKNMQFIETMLTTILQELSGSLTMQIPDRDGNLTAVDFTPPWPRVTLREAIARECGIDFAHYNSASALLEAIKSNGIRLDVAIEKLGRGNLIDQLYKKVSRPGIVRPTFITEHPLDLSPLARRNDDHPAVTDRFQLVVSGWEIVNGYSELIDPVDQAERFAQQAHAHAGGDSDAHRKDDDFVTALEYGCPPCSGIGIGIDRIVALLTQQSNLRDVVLFPLMKPDERSTRETKKSTELRPHDAREQSQPTMPCHHSSTLSPAHAMQHLSAPDASHLLQHAVYGHLLPAAHTLLTTHADHTRTHLLATGAAMEAFAKRLGGDPQTWKVAGMLHDLDWDMLDKDAKEHCGTTLEQLLATIDAPAELLGDIRAHYAHVYGERYPLDTMLRKTLYCVDELTGFIIAVALVRPSKSLHDVEVKSILKKLKDKTFAAQVDRTHIRACATLLNMPLEECVGITLEAMQSIATEIGL